ncbi:MAG TPA: HNH endonuclease [Ktedonobacterales bacterium]
MTTAERMAEIARTDSTFALHDGHWVGRCLICGGPLRFEVRTGEGANIEHIMPRTLGGDNDLRNLGITHPRCNAEKGRNWDSGKRTRQQPERYAAIVGRLRDERMRRWRGPDLVPASNASGREA